MKENNLTWSHILVLQSKIKKYQNFASFLKSSIRLNIIESNYCYT